MLAVQRNDVTAFESLFRKYIGQVSGFAMSFVGSRARAEEIAQEALVQVYRTRDRYQPRAQFSTWLYRIATNLCLSEVRRTEFRIALRAPDRDERERSDDDVRELPDRTGRSGEEELMDREGVVRIQQALRRLPPQQRAALLLARVEGLSYADVAESLRCSVSAVKSLIHRATLALRDDLGPDGR